MATEIFINTDLRDLTANAVASKSSPTKVVEMPQIVEGETFLSRRIRQKSVL